MTGQPTEAVPTARHPELAGRLAVVTGGAKGIGLGIATRLVAEGLHVVVADRDGPALDTAIEQLEQVARRAAGSGPAAGASAVRGDVSKVDEVDRLFAHVADRPEPLHLLVNNAADLRRHRVLDAHHEVLEAQLASNVTGPYLCSQRAAAAMVAGPAPTGGVIVNLSSVGSTRAHDRGLPYDMTKGAIDAMTRAMAIDLGPDGVRVNAVAPGVTRTHRTRHAADSAQAREVAQLIPLDRWGTTADIAAAVAFLASDDAAYITGQILAVDGGISAQLNPRGTRAL